MRQESRDVQCREFLETLVRPVSSGSHPKVQSQSELEDPPPIPTLGWLEFDFIEGPGRFSHNIPLTYFLSYYPQMTHNFGNTDMIVNFLCQLDRAIGWPDIWLRISEYVHGCVPRRD